MIQKHSNGTGRPSDRDMHRLNINSARYMPVAGESRKAMHKPSNGI